MFIGRKKELDILKGFINKTSMNVGLIYGRRRVGKSELIKQALKNNDIISIFYECKQTTESNNALSICAEIESVFNIPFSNNDLEKVLDSVFRLSIKDNIVLVLDEYPYLKEIVVGIDSILQSLIDKYKDKTNLKLILCGSYIDVMKSLINHGNPLYGRFDLKLELKPLNYYESQLFYNDYSNEDKVKIYSVFGGIPYYNKLIDVKKSVKENIINLIAREGSILENEIPIYLLGQLSKINNANIVFEVLAKNYTKYKDILSVSHISSGPTLIDILDKLIEMNLVYKSYPINEPNNKRKVGYYIADNLTSFYYKYIYPNLSKLKILDSNTFYDMFIERDFLSQYVPHKFEEIVKEYLIKENLLGNIKPPFYEIGKYYYDDPINKINGEFDIVTKDELGYIFYEVKYRNELIDINIVEEEIEQVKRTNLNCYKYGFVSKTGFKFNDDNLILLTLADIYI